MASAIGQPVEYGVRDMNCCKVALGTSLKSVAALSMGYAPLVGLVLEVIGYQVASDPNEHDGTSIVKEGIGFTATVCAGYAAATSVGIALAIPTVVAGSFLTTLVLIPR